MLFSRNSSSLVHEAYPTSQTWTISLMKKSAGWHASIYHKDECVYPLLIVANWRLQGYLLEQPTGIKRQASVKIEDGDIPRSSRPLKIMKTEGGNKIQIDLTGDD